MALADYYYDDDSLFDDLDFLDDYESPTVTCEVTSIITSSFRNSGQDSDSLTTKSAHSSSSSDDDSLSDKAKGSSNSCIGDGEFQCNGESTSKKRKRRRYPNAKDADGNWLVPKIPIPRILKSDIRRSYGLMFANVYNSGDYQYMMTFINQFVSQNYLFRFTKYGISRSLQGSKDMLGQLWYERMTEAPDIVFHFDAGRIKVRSDGTAVLSGKFILRGSRVGMPEEHQHNDTRLGGLLQDAAAPVKFSTDAADDSVASSAPCGDTFETIDKLNAEEQRRTASSSNNGNILDQSQSDEEYRSNGTPPVQTATMNSSGFASEKDIVCTDLESFCFDDECPQKGNYSTSSTTASETISSSLASGATPIPSMTSMTSQPMCSFEVLGELSMHLDSQYLLECIDMCVMGANFTPIDPQLLV